MKRRRLLKRKK
jgi:hypothetical protein